MSNWAAIRSNCAFTPLSTSPRRRPQQIVQTKNVRNIEFSQPRPAIPLHLWVPTHLPVMQPRRQIDSFDAVFPAPPAERRPFPSNFVLVDFSASFEPPICR